MTTFLREAACSRRGGEPLRTAIGNFAGVHRLSRRGVRQRLQPEQRAIAQCFRVSSCGTALNSSIGSTAELLNTTDWLVQGATGQFS